MSEHWSEQSVCRDYPEDMFPHMAKGRPGRNIVKADPYAAAKEHCVRCPVLDQCVAYALQLPYHEPNGMLGMMTPSERARRRRERGQTLAGFPSPISDRRLSHHGR